MAIGTLVPNYVPIRDHCDFRDEFSQAFIRGETEQSETARSGLRITLFQRLKP
jgi:hypothetical protein